MQGRRDPRATETVALVRDASRHLAAERLGGTPRVLASDDVRGTLLLGARPGTTDLPPDHPHVSAVHEAAGRWLARLHRARPFGHEPLPLQDAYRLRADRGLARAAWSERPHLRAAFLGGYHARGGPADPDAAWMTALIALDAVSTVAWAVRHGEDEVEAVGRRALVRALASR